MQGNNLIDYTHVPTSTTSIPTLTPSYSPTTPTTEPTHKPTLTPTYLPTAVDAQEFCSDMNDTIASMDYVLFKSSIRMDRWSISLDENEWRLVKSNTNETILEVFSDDYSTEQIVTHSVCLPFNYTYYDQIENSDDCYYFLLIDDWGDALSDSEGTENYWLSIDNNYIEFGEWKTTIGSRTHYVHRIDFCISLVFMIMNVDCHHFYV